MARSSYLLFNGLRPTVEPEGGGSRSDTWRCLNVVGGLLSFLHQWIVAQRLMVVEVLVAESDGEYPLPHQRRHRMFDVGLGSPIDKA